MLIVLLFSIVWISLVIMKILGIFKLDGVLIGKCMLLMVLNLLEILLVSFVNVCWVLCLNSGLNCVVW